MKSIQRISGSGPEPGANSNIGSDDSVQIPAARTLRLSGVFTGLWGNHPMALVPFPRRFQTMKTEEENLDMKVLVAYEDFAAGTRAMAMLKRIGSQCGAGQLIHMMWRFDVLSDESFFDLAVNEALAADIIIIATRDGKSLPQRIKDWIARWLLMKERRPLALVATLDYHSAKPRSQSCVLPYLTKLAHYGQMQFFANGGADATGFNFAKINTDD
jgi:hypothetical protein